jgi:protein O-GlcNAc transferase
MNINKAKEIASERYRAGNLQQAAEIYLEVLEIQPSDIDVLNSLGAICYELGNYDMAIALFKTAIQFKPDFASAYSNLGLAFNDKGQLDDATVCYRKALSLDPNFASAYYNLGNTLMDLGSYSEARVAYNKAIESQPSFVTARWALCLSYLPIIYPDQSSIRISRRYYSEELIKLRDTISLETPHDIKKAVEAIGSTQPFFLAYQGLNNRALQQVYGELVCKIMSAAYPQWANRPASPSKSSGGPIKVGIVSGFFCKHSNWKLPIRGWIENFDKRRVNLYGYYTGNIKDKETEIARQHFTRFVEDVHSFQRLCQIIREDDLQILIYPEIGMHPLTLMLAALRLSPIQCASWGHPDTSGLPTIDYYLSSDLMEPPAGDEHYTEKLIRLPNLSVYYIPQTNPSVSVNRDTFGLRPKSILYFCCQGLYKYLPQYDEIYPRIAKRVDNCQFLFISFSKSAFVTEQFRSRLSEVYSRFGLDAAKYVTFLPHLETALYHAINALSDIYLDSIDWSGCNTTFEAISHNLPIVTLPGKLMRGRHSTAILTMMGITETIAKTLDEYIELAIRLGSDSKWRKQISEKIAANKQLVYRDKTCIIALEAFFERVVRGG